MGEVVIDDFKVLELKIFIKGTCGVGSLEESLRDLRKNVIKRPTAGTADGGATVVSRQVPGRLSPHHGPHNPQATNHATQNPTKILTAPPL
ncbi:hypothetical protein ACLOJK_005023 [Asimina triloba]